MLWLKGLIKRQLKHNVYCYNYLLKYNYIRIVVRVAYNLRFQVHGVHLFCICYQKATRQEQRKNTKWVGNLLFATKTMCLDNNCELTTLNGSFLKNVFQMLNNTLYKNKELDKRKKYIFKWQQNEVHNKQFFIQKKKLKKYKTKSEPNKNKILFSTSCSY